MAETFGMVRNLFSPREVVELLLLIGHLRMICGVMTTLEVEVESPFGAGLAPRSRVQPSSRVGSRNGLRWSATQSTTLNLG